jgi:hypothetical protein
MARVEFHAEPSLMNTRLVVSGALVASLALAGCATTPTKSTSFDGTPEWANGEAPIGCGIGMAKHLGNKSLTRNSAVNMARDELARSLSTKMEGMMKQYADQGETAGTQYSEQKNTQVVRSIVDQTLSGTGVKKTAMVGQDYYALVCMDLAGFKGLIDDMNGMNAKMKQALKARADSEFADLDRVLKESRAASAE